LPVSTIKERLNLEVFNTLGQQIYWRTLDNVNGSYEDHKLNMSYMSAGVYFVKIGNNKASNIQRIIVK